MKTTITNLAALAVAITLFGTGPALTFSSNHSRSNQARLQIPNQAQQIVRKAVKPKSLKRKAVTTADSKKTKQKQSASSKARSQAKAVTKPQKKATATMMRTRKEIATIPGQTLKSRKRTIPSTAAMAKAKKAAQQKLKDQSNVAEGGPQPEHPTAPKRKLLPPRLDRTAKPGNGRLDDFDDFRDAADAMRDLRHLQDAVNRDQWGQEGGPAWPGNGHGTPGDDFKSHPGGGDLPDDLPSGAKQFETEGAPDQAAYFNDAVPGGVSGGTAPDDGGPRYQGSWQPSHDGASGPRGPGDLKDPRGPASEDGDVFNEDGSGTRTVNDGYGGVTVTDYNEDGTRTRSRNTSFDGSTLVIFYDSDGTTPRASELYDEIGILVERTRASRFDDGWYEHTTTYTGPYILDVFKRNGVVIDKMVRPRNPDPTDDQVSDWEMLDWARAGRTTWMLTPHDRRTLSERTSEMARQPGREGAGGGGSAAPRLGQDAVINNGDSSFNVQPVTPLGYGHGPSGGIDGDCITCD